MNLILVSTAESDYAEILKYYVAVGEYEGDYSLADRFKKELGTMFHFIRKFPESARCVGEDTIRKTLMRKFPFYILYEIRGNDILVFSICDQRRNPSEMESRISKFKS